MVFDCSDLMQYFDDNRLPTGVQRAQINIVAGALADKARARLCRSVFYCAESDAWHAIGGRDFLALIEAVGNLATCDGADWRSLRKRLGGSTRANQFVFVKGDVLISLGACWWLEDHLLLIRTLRRKKRVTFISLIYDCIPLVAPEHCAPHLVDQFRGWIGGMLRNSDGFLACSQSTAQDLRTVARTMKLPAPEVYVVPLDGDLRASNGAETPGASPPSIEEVLERADMAFAASGKPPYVLCVSTLESRKNHLLLFQVWNLMIARRGVRATPYLQCVGKPGYSFDAALTYVKSRPLLESKIRFLETIDDSSLAALYANAAFTVYPSFYEGWGLPITESFCFGKAVASSNVSSLPEAGADLAQYFDPYNLREACAAIEKLAFTADYRKAIEARIQQTFKPREWPAIASQALDAAQAIKNNSYGTTRDDFAGDPKVEWKTLYTMRARQAGDDITACRGGEMRLGDGWRRCEDWGVWTRSRRAILALRFPDEARGEIALYIQLKAPPGGQINARITACSTGEACEIELGDSEPRFERLVFKKPLGDRLVQEFALESSQLTDVGAFTDNRDRRLVGCGVLQIVLSPDSELAGRVAMMEAMSFARPRPVAVD